MPAPEIIHQLVAKFNENREAYRSGKYNEARLRQEFLDQFFIALGWDVYNTKGAAPQYADVEIETSLDIEGTSKSPDYTFRVGPERKFFVEAKKPAVNIQYDIHPAYQLKRYAWNAHLPISILTDFEEFAVYNCKQKPNPSDSPAAGRELFIKFTEYIERWDEIAGIFSREAVWKGALDRYADTSKGKKGTTEVDDEFLKDMNEWRLVLARNIALRNMQIADEQQLNYAVQMTLDRIIFLRICEDRGIEPEEQLKTLCATPGVYPRLLELFRHADLKYNSGLFNFTHDKNDNTPPDTFTPALAIDDRVLKEIIHGLYYPCPYIFKEIPVEILGQVYEQFLGQVIRLTAGHQAKVEEKPEVRKAGGVYYTPKYIVDYIVANTVGKLLEGRTPAEAAALKIVDPACGSGSFLLGAFQYLIDWHEKWYLDNDPAKWTRGKAPALNEVTNGYRLTTLKKKEILLNNLHGVDIDAQAVEVTKLSLLLKVLEEESGQLSLGLERALPDLGRNIQCGNSLIGEDYFAGQLVVDPAERRRVNPFDWQRAFPDVFAQGGFDAVIGNPPYIQLSMESYYSENTNKFLNQKYSGAMGRQNTYGYFIELGLVWLLNRQGLISFIVPNTILTQSYYRQLRELILRNSIKNLTTYTDPVFQDAVVETIVFVFAKKQDKISPIKIVHFDNKKMTFNEHEIDQSIFEITNEKSFLVNIGESELNLKNKLDLIQTKLEAYVNINQAIALKADRSKSLFHDKKDNNFKKVLDGRNINRYQLIWSGYYLAYDINKIHSCKRTDIFEYEEKIFFRRVGSGLIATLDVDQYYALNTLVVISPKPDYPYNLRYILALINSRLLGFYYVTYLKSTKKIFSEIQARQLAKLPIRPIDFSISNEIETYNTLITFVNRMLDLHKRVPATPQEQEQLRREIDATDRQIDQLVYQLYGLTDEEIRIVEGSN